MNNNIAAQLHKTLEDPNKCPTCRHNTPAYSDQFVVYYCYRKWFLGMECEYEKGE